MGEPEQPDENKRIYTERETHTGEEEDKVVHNVRAKLYAMQDGNWVERGMGPLKVNLTKREGEKEGARIGASSFPSQYHPQLLTGMERTSHSHASRCNSSTPTKLSSVQRILHRSLERKVCQIHDYRRFRTYQLYGTSTSTTSRPLSQKSSRY